MRPTLLAILLASIPALATAQDATTPGALSAEHPTLEHLSVDWLVSGDDDLDGTVAVRFRETFPEVQFAVTGDDAASLSALG